MESRDLFAPSSETRRGFVSLEISDLTKIGMTEEVARDFLRLRSKFLEKPLVEWDSVEPPPAEFLKDYSTLKEPDKTIIKELLDKLVVVQLNGGLGYFIGCKGPKCGIQILKKSGGITILDCKVMQIIKLNKEYGCNIPLVLMNSPRTDSETEVLIQKYNKLEIDIHTFVQNVHPFMYKDTLSPLPKSQSSLEGWYPPGSGEVFSAMYRQGLLEKFKNEGKELLFISNMENLGSSVDLKLLHYIANPKVNLDFLLETTNRISTDQAGGFAIKYKDRHVHILEISQIPSQVMSKFSLSNFKYWNTNNIWTRIGVVIDMMKQQQIDLDFIVKYKVINGKNIAQLETPVAMSIQSFPKAASILVPRSRYRPVKSTSDLLQVQSELFELQHGLLVASTKRSYSSDPLVKLGDEFKSMAEYERRFKTIPNILELDHLTVSGDVYFGANVTLKGTVIIVANSGSRIDIPDGVVLDNKIVTGSLQINEM